MLQLPLPTPRPGVRAGSDTNTAFLACPQNGELSDSPNALNEFDTIYYVAWFSDAGVRFESSEGKSRRRRADVEKWWPLTVLGLPTVSTSIS